MRSGNQKLFILDGNSIISRYYYGMPEKKSPDGLNVNGVFGFTRFLCNFLKKEVLNDKDCSNSIIVCFDRTRSNFRKEICPNYKKNRSPLPENFFYQMNLCEEVCGYFNIPTDHNNRYEADDLIASYCKNFESLPNISIKVLSNDKDLLQLVSNIVHVFNVVKKKNFDEIAVLETMQIYPHQVAEFLAICGDASDNISGILNVGPKTTIKLLNKYGTLEDIINSEEGKKRDFTPARVFLQLTKLAQNAPLKNLSLSTYILPTDSIISYLHRYGFLELLNFFEE